MSYTVTVFLWYMVYFLEHVLLICAFNSVLINNKCYCSNTSRIVNLCSTLHAAGLPPAGEEMNCLGFFQCLSLKASSAPKPVQRFPAVPDDSWPLYSPRLNCRGSNCSKEVPRWAVGAQQCLSTSDESVSLDEETPCIIKNETGPTV